MSYNGCLSLRKLGKSVKVRNLPYPFLRGQPFNTTQYIHSFYWILFPFILYMTFIWTVKSRFYYYNRSKDTVHL